MARPLQPKPQARSFSPHFCFSDKLFENRMNGCLQFCNSSFCILLVNILSGHTSMLMQFFSSSPKLELESTHLIVSQNSRNYLYLNCYKAAQKTRKDCTNPSPPRPQALDAMVLGQRVHHCTSEVEPRRHYPYKIHKVPLLRAAPKDKESRTRITGNHFSGFQNMRINKLIY